MDVPARNAAAIAQLHPLVRPLVTAWLAEVNAERSCWLITDGYRSEEKQREVFARGRTAPGEPCRHGATRRQVGTCRDHPFGAPVTWTTKSWHQCARAVDVAHVTSDGRLEWPDQPGAWQAVADAAARHGLEWGYAAWGKDMPHFMYCLDKTGRRMTIDRALVEWRGMLAAGRG